MLLKCEHICGLLLLCYIIIQRKKLVEKSYAAEEWDHQRQNALELLYSWLQLPLQKLWNPPIIEDTFLT